MERIIKPKPIVVIYFPDRFVSASHDRNWIYEYMRALNGESDTEAKWSLKKEYCENYFWFCFYKDDINEPEFKVFYEKDFTEIKYQELKQLVLDSIKKEKA